MLYINLHMAINLHLEPHFARSKEDWDMVAPVGVPYYGCIRQR